MRKKRKGAILALLLAVTMALGTVTSYGAVAYEKVKAIEEGGAGEAAYTAGKNKGGPAGGYAGWNRKSNAIQAKKAYVNRLVRTSDHKSKVVTASGLRVFKNIDYGGNGVMDTDTFFVFDVSDFTGAKNGAVQIKYTGYKIADPGNPNADGKGYVWIDIVLTVTNWTKVDSGKYANTRNAFEINKELVGGYPRINICNIGELTIKYDYYLAGKNKKYELKTNATYRDIDARQGIAFSDGSIEKTAVTSNTNMMYGKNDNDWHVFSSSGRAAESDNSRNALGLMYNASGSKITYISNQNDAGGNANFGHPDGAWALFAPSTYSWFDPVTPAPVKSITDSNETEVEANTVSKKAPQWTYNVTQHIPAGINTAFYYSSYVMTDQIDTCLVVTDVKIKNQNDRNVTDNFNIVTGDDNVVTATAKAAYLQDENFYGGVQGNAFTMEISVKLDEAKFEADKAAHGHVISEDQIEFTNKASVRFDNDTPKDTNEVKTVITSNAPAPVAGSGKTVSDADETRTTENWLEAPDERYTYEVTHSLPAIYPLIDEETGEEGEMPYFTDYTFTDTLEDILRPISAKVMSGGTDVSSRFRIGISGQTVTASMTGGALNSDDSYGTSYTLVIETELRADRYDTQEELAPWLSADGLTLTIPNSAVVTAADYEGTTSDRGTNEVKTYVGLPEHAARGPGLEVHKSVEPYEFQVGDEIPYSITVHHNNPEATAMDVVVTDTTLPKGLNVKSGSIKVGGINRAYTAKEVPGGIQFTTRYLKYGEKVTIDFIAIAEKSLNGKVLPNTVTAGAWGVPDMQDSTTIYINSPKIDVDKTISKKARASINNTINYEVSIKQINPGCFMRDIWLEDEILTKGVELDKGSFSVTDVDGNLLALNTDYTINVKDNRFKLVFTRGNMGYYADPVIPAWDDARGKATGDYDGLELQKEYIVTYTATIDDSSLAGKEVKNRAVVPGTENTNGDVIRDDPDVPSGGDEAAVRIIVDGPNLVVEKVSDKREYHIGQTAAYKLQVGLSGFDMRAENVVIKDGFRQNGIAKLNPDSIKVSFNDDDITWQCRITVDDDLQEFVIDTGRNLTEKDTITVEYLADMAGDGVLENIMSAAADNAPEVTWDNDIIVRPIPGLRIEKISDQEEYITGETGTYHVTVRQVVPETAAENIVVKDAFQEEGMEIDADSIRVMMGEEDITEACSIEALPNSWNIITGKSLALNEAIVVSYDVTFLSKSTEDGQVHNRAKAAADNALRVKTEHAVELLVSESVPEPEATVENPPMATPAEVKLMPTDPGKADEKQEVKEKEQESGTAKTGDGRGTAVLAFAVLLALSGMAIAYICRRC